MGSKVLIINTGGTLSSVARQHGLAPGLTTDSMLKELHIVAGEAELSTLEFSSLDSANIFPEDWAELARLISENRKQADGIVVIHGTDTLAYTSSMLSFMLQNIQIPVVITGSQLSISNPVARKYSMLAFRMLSSSSVRVRIMGGEIYWVCTVCSRNSFTNRS